METPTLASRLTLCGWLHKEETSAGASCVVDTAAFCFAWGVPALVATETSEKGMGESACDSKAAVSTKAPSVTPKGARPLA
jgi:hypothetical protein